MYIKADETGKNRLFILPDEMFTFKISDSNKSEVLRQKRIEELRGRAYLDNYDFRCGNCNYLFNFEDNLEGCQGCGNLLPPLYKKEYKEPMKKLIKVAGKLELILERQHVIIETKNYVKKYFGTRTQYMLNNHIAECENFIYR